MTWVTRLSLSICVIWVTKVFCVSKMIKMTKLTWAICVTWVTRLSRVTYVA